MANLVQAFIQKFTDPNGEPLSGGKIYSYQAGTSTPLATYTDQSQTTQNANPIILDDEGKASIWVGSAAYKFVLKDSNDVTLDTVDNVSFIAPGAIITSMLANDSVTTQKIVDAAVTTDKIDTGAITEDKLDADSVSTAKIQDEAITTQKIDDGAVTLVKIGSSNEAVSASSGAYVNATSTPTDITNLSVSLTVSGNKKVEIKLISGGGATPSYAVCTAINAEIHAFRGSTDIGSVYIDTTNIPAGSLSWLDSPAAGTHTYKVKGFRSAIHGGTLFVNDFKLWAKELP